MDLPSLPNRTARGRSNSAASLPLHPPPPPPKATTYTWIVDTPGYHGQGQPLLSYAEAVFQGAGVMAQQTPGNGTLTITASIMGQSGGDGRLLPT